MVTCYLRYLIDPFKLEEFEHYGKLWIPLVEKFGGKHHGYFLPSEGANNIALAMFTFPSLAAYEEYRTLVRGRRRVPGCLQVRGRHALHPQLRTQLLQACLRVSARGCNAT